MASLFSENFSTGIFYGDLKWKLWRIIEKGIGRSSPCEVNSRGGLVRVGDWKKGTLKSIFTA
jgi:hypothetical protein